MSDEEFLTRWSRRKREANTAGEAPPPAQPVEPQDTPASGALETPADVEFDLLSLPPIESITGRTDITAFLRKGIPEELSRTALRRAWRADPAIRDFVGLAENAWDFNDPNAMPGFGPLDYTAEQVSALVRRIVEGVAETAKSNPNVLAEAEGGEPSEAGFSPPSNPVKTREDPRPLDESAAAELPSNPAASQPVTQDGESLPRR